MNWYFRSGILINTILSIVIYGILYCFDVPVIRIFNKVPLIAGTEAIWIAPFAAETITLIIAMALKKTSKLVYQ